MNQIYSVLTTAVSRGATNHAACYLRLLRQQERQPMTEDDVLNAIWTIALSEPHNKRPLK